MASLIITDHNFTFDSGKTHYIASGPQDGPLLIFIHGWIAVADTWIPQFEAFSRLGFRVVAPDTRGYGGSTVTSNVQDYRLEQHVIDMLALLSHLGRDQAVWIGHDWGCALVWALAAHHPEVCAGVSCMTVPYRTIEFGLDKLVSLVNRDIYPVDQYPLGPWDYQAYHKEQRERCSATLEKDPENTIKILYSNALGGSEGYRKPAFTATMRKDGGWFGGADKAPHIDLENTMLKGHEAIYKKLVDTVKNNGTAGPNSYYLNHDVNPAYTEKSVNGGILNMPVLFIEAKWDHICDTALSRFSEPMRQTCTNLTECSLEAGHWVAWEKPEETNAAIARWLATKVPTQWPGYWKSPFVSNGKD